MPRISSLIPKVKKVPMPKLISSSSHLYCRMMMSPAWISGRCRGSLIALVKSTSIATRDFIERLQTRAPSVLVVAIATSLDRETRGRLIEAGAAAVFERHSDIALYRREAASIVDFWARQRLDKTGT